MHRAKREMATSSIPSAVWTILTVRSRLRQTMKWKMNFQKAYRRKTEIPQNTFRTQMFWISPVRESGMSSVPIPVPPFHFYKTNIAVIELLHGFALIHVITFSEKTSQILKELETHKSALTSSEISNDTTPLHITNPDDRVESSDSESDLELNNDESGAMKNRSAIFHFILRTIWFHLISLYCDSQNRRNSKLLRMQSRKKWDSNDLDEQLAGMGEMYQHMKELATPRSAEWREKWKSYHSLSREWNAQNCWIGDHWLVFLSSIDQYKNTK